MSSLTKTESIIHDLSLNFFIQAISSGLSYKEGIVLFKTCLFMMEDVMKNPNDDDDINAKRAEKFIKESLESLVTFS
jgi:hypothetical protein